MSSVGMVDGELTRKNPKNPFSVLTIVFFSGGCKNCLVTQELITNLGKLCAGSLL